MYGNLILQSYKLPYKIQPASIFLDCNSSYLNEHYFNQLFIKAKKQREKEEQEKWKNVPAWKRKLMMEKSKEKEQKTKEEIEKVSRCF